MLEDINSILNSGDVSKLFPAEELIPILEELRPEATKQGRSTASDALYAFLIERVRDNLHVVLCMSPVGAEFRNRIRMFPSLTSQYPRTRHTAQWPICLIHGGRVLITCAFVFVCNCSCVQTAAPSTPSSVGP